MVALVDGSHGAKGLGTDRSWAYPRGRGQCPACEAPVLAKCGRIVSWHWAHLPGSRCPFEREPETDWHRAWKGLFPLDQVERRLGERRVDVLLPDGTGLEFQHSSIGVDEIRRRERATRRMVWIFDAREPAAAGRLRLRDRKSRGSATPTGYRTLRWEHPRKTVAACCRQVLLDLGPEPVGVAPLLRLGRLYPDAPCGGYGWLVDAGQLWGTR